MCTSLFDPTFLLLLSLPPPELFSGDSHTLNPFGNKSLACNGSDRILIGRVMSVLSAFGCYQQKLTRGLPGMRKLSFGLSIISLDDNVGNLGRKAKLMCK